MREQGYVVIRGVANASELAHAHELLWAFLEGAGVGVARDRPETWTLTLTLALALALALALTTNP